MPLDMTRDLARRLLAGKYGRRRVREEEIDAFLEKWSEGDPVMPVSMVCGFLTQWKDVVGREADRDDAPKHVRDSLESIRRHAESTFLAIRKSNLLSRLIYGGEQVRTRRCPHHQGQWSGCKTPEESECKGACFDGMNVTGWLPEE